jgi:hypothetical protein
LVVGVKVRLQQSIIQIEQKQVITGVKSNLQRSFIQKNCKMLDYRGKMQFTEINHSNRAKNAGL